MKKVLSFIKKYYSYVILFFLCIVSVIAIFILNKVSPFGHESLMTIDFFHQYGPMLSEFFDRIWLGKNLIYSFNTGLGIPIYRNFFNYMASPLNIIIFLFKRRDLLTSFSVIIGFRSVISAFTMFYYLKRKFNVNKLYYIGMAMLYAYSAYFTAYYWNIMWLDGMVFLPLIALGIENIVNKNNGFLYLVSLAIMLCSNYFIGYMLCIFSCIYFVSYLIIKTDKFCFKNVIKKIGLFSICSLIAGAINAWALIPMFDALKTTNATTGTMPTDQYYGFTLINFVKNHLTGVGSTVLSSDIINLPNVSCGILSVGLFFTFVLSKEIKLKVKLVYISMLLFLMISFYLGPLDYIWHGFHVPNDLPFRYSFIYSFIFIVISSYALKNIKNESFIKMIIIYIMCIAFITYVKLSDFLNISQSMIIFNYVLVSLYFLIYFMYHFFPKIKKLLVFVLLIVVSIECVVSVDSNWSISHDIEQFYADYDSTKNSIDYLNKLENNQFYRVDRNYISTLNDGAWFNYNGLSTFSSMAYNNLSVLNYELGIPGNYINSYYYKRTTPIYDLMFNIKYQIGSYSENSMYEFLTDEYGEEIHKFKYTAGLMFGVNKTIKEWNPADYRPFAYQNEFIQSATGIDNVMYPLYSSNEEIIFNTEYETISRITYSNLGENIYIYTTPSNVNYIVINDSIYYNDDFNIDQLNFNYDGVINNYHSINEPFIINEKMYDEDITVYVSYNYPYYNGLFVYALDNDKFLNAYNILKTNEVKIIDFNENYIKGEINLLEDKSIYTSIPYDKGWKVYSNGKRIETYAIKDALLGFDIENGSNIIELKYVPPYMYLGICISGSTILLLVIYFFIKKKK